VQIVDSFFQCCRFAIAPIVIQLTVECGAWCG